MCVCSDILISNAGIVRVADFLDMSEEDFDDVIRVNLKGCFLVRDLILVRDAMRDGIGKTFAPRDMSPCVWR